MKTLKPLKFISVEGFWEKPTHEARIEEAAEKLQAIPEAFAIATATHAPASCVSFTNLPLGQYTANRLIKDYGIAPTRILPAYLFDQKTTYTIVDAYSNAIMIGWLCSGLTKSKKTINAELSPVTSGFIAQGERIIALNNRSLQALNNININAKVIVDKSMVIPFEHLPNECPEEFDKLTKIKKPGEVIATGTWNGNSGIKRSFNDIDAMHRETTKAFSKIFGSHADYSVLFKLSALERILLTLMWCAKANTNALTNDTMKNCKNIIGNYFAEELKATDIDLAKNNLIKYGYMPFNI
jgi:hypothetical protein